MSTQKPDYYIAHNGLPNILITRSRHMITRTTKSSCDRMLCDQPQQQQIHPQAKNKRFIGFALNQQAMQPCGGDKNAKNRAIKESLRSSKATKDLINTQIVRNYHVEGLSATKCATDNSEHPRNVKRIPRPIETDIRDNKLSHQRKYDNTIFRHDLPDRIVLPPLPI